MSPFTNPTVWVVPFVPDGIGTRGEEELPGPTRDALTQLSAGRGDVADVAADPALRDAGLALYHYGPHGRLEPVLGNQALLDGDTFAAFVRREADTTDTQPPTHTWPIALPTTPHPTGEEQHLHYSDCSCTTCAPAPGRHADACTCPACEKTRVCAGTPSATPAAHANTGTTASPGRDLLAQRPVVLIMLPVGLSHGDHTRTPRQVNTAQNRSHLHKAAPQCPKVPTLL